MRKNRPLTPQEAKLWHLVGKTTKPTKGNMHHNLEKLEDIINQLEPIKPQNTAKIIKPIENKIENPNNSSKPINAQISDLSHEKKLRRGQIEIDKTIDLHGLNQFDAENILRDFILNSYNTGLRNLLIITGKGNNIKHNIDVFELYASRRGILRMRLKDWLNKPDLRKYIAGISQANQKHGGSGAFYVRLKAKI